MNLVKMTVLKTVTALTLVSVAAAFAPATRFASRAAVSRSAGFDMEASIQKTRDMRLAHLEEQAMFALQLAVENNAHPVFPNAMIAGDWCVSLAAFIWGSVEAVKGLLATRFDRVCSSKGRALKRFVERQLVAAAERCLALPVTLFFLLFFCIVVAAFAA